MKGKRRKIKNLRTIYRNMKRKFMIFNSTGANILVNASKHNDIIAIKDVGLDKQYLIWIKRYSRIQYYHDYLNKNEILA